MSRRQPSHALAAIAVALVAGSVLARRAPVVAAVCWTLLAVVAVLSAAWAARRTSGAERRGWQWIAAGCAAHLAGRLVWDYYELGARVPPPFPSLADPGYLALYPCFAVGLQSLLPARLPGRQQPTVILDATLVTFTAAALTYELLLAPLLDIGGARLPLATSIAWAAIGVVVLWALSLQLVRQRSLVLGTAGLAITGLLVLCVINATYAPIALRGTYVPGGWLDIGWQVGLALLVVAAALAGADTQVGGLASDTPRAIAVVVAIAGIMALALWSVLRDRSESAAVWVALGIAIIGGRVVYALRADRQYAELLEHEVAAQTRSLMDSLAATAVAERNLRLVMEAVPDAIVVMDAEGRQLDMNTAARELFAAAPADAQRSLFAVLDPGAHAIARENLAAAFEGAVRTFDIRFRRADGIRGTAAVSYAPVRADHGVSRVLAVVRDVTHEKRTAAQLQQAEKLAAIGQLVSGVAHEINNPAAIISGFAQTLLLDDVNPEHRDMAQMIYDEASRIGRITQNLLAFARAGGKERTLIDLNDVLRRTFALRSYHLTTLSITVTLELDPSDPKIWANASDVQQMLLNLVINAEQALVTIDPPRSITIRSQASEQDVRVEVADNGPGVPAEIRERIFDPFFTTKPEGVGTGLGLSICYGIVREHAGRISLESEHGQGTRFIIQFPRDPRSGTRPSDDTRLPAGRPVRQLRVLLVDDELSLRNALVQFLARRGISATGVGDGAEALHAIDHDSFDVIVSDVRMPGMSGGDFVARLRRERPDLVARLIFSTGDAFARDTAELLEAAGVPTVTKPFDFATLERVVREVAARAQGESGDTPEAAS
ncbi:MAG TPA: ATP-binding protein [Gemmatimonadales bacterium]|nr:ATP-binding protein [Gemmatimonadales bacterium]